MTTYTEATTARTEAVILAASLAQAEVNGTNVAGFDATAPQRAIFHTDARALAAAEALRVVLAQAGYVTTSPLAGDAFVDEALTWFDEVRIPASRAEWSFKLTNASAGAYTLTTAQGEYVAQANDGTYFESAPLSYVTILAGGTALARFIATAAGVTGNQNPGSVTHLAVGRPGLSVTNASAAALDLAGRAAETNAEAIARCLGKWATLGAGWTRTSFDYLIPRFAPTVTRWLVRDDNPNGPGTIEVVLANASGAATGPELAAVLAGLGAANVMTLGTGGLSVIPATVKTINLVGTFYGDGTNPTVESEALAAAQALQRGFPIGGDSDGLLRLELLTAVLMGGGFPVAKPLVIQGANGSPTSIIISGFSGAKDIALSGPAGNTALAMTDVLYFEGAGLVFA